MSLETLAKTALVKSGGDIEKALPQFVRAVRTANLIDDLARKYLSQIASGSGQSENETRSAAAGPASPKHKLGSIKVPQYDVKPHRRRTHAEKQAALAAAAASIEAVFELEINGRAIGNIRFGELAALRHDLVDDASSKLMLGIDAARAAVLAELIQNHAVVPDHSARVRDVIDAPTLRGLVAEAEEEAPRRIAEAMRRASGAIENRSVA